MTRPAPTTETPLGLLLVDDHPVVRAGLKALLEADGTLAVLAEAGDGAQALAALDDQHVDVVIMDLQMPTMDGPTAIRRLRDRGGPPVLVLTTYETQADIVSALEAGATGYLLKDSPAEQLREAVRQTAQGRSVLAPSVTQQLVQRAARPAQSLSAREIEILQGLATGASNRELAAQLVISEATVKTHLLHVYDKLGVDNRTAAVHRAREQRLI
ncbi:response regulator transcription factor [Kocuria sp. 2SI]|uniref:response regulator n=1 Tax=Kocuria sp. 2SI TaxID=2502203 RepID=UPI0010FA4FD8|nr:response regulator transcription factor [Kocuria sp. 2SI]